MSFIQLYKNGAIHKSAIARDQKPYTFVVKGQTSEKFESIADLVEAVNKRDISSEARSKSSTKEPQNSNGGSKNDSKKKAKTVVARSSKKKDAK